MNAVSHRPKWATLEKAVEMGIEGSSDVKQLTRWIDHWNKRLDTVNKVGRRYGKVELNSLAAAVAEDCQNHAKNHEASKNAYLGLSRPRRTARKKTTPQKGEPVNGTR